MGQAEPLAATTTKKGIKFVEKNIIIGLK